MKVVMIVVVVSFVLPWNSAVAYGGGGGSGGVSQAGDSSFGGGAVSWSSNPNGLDVMGSSIWHGRPENLEKGPYQPGKAVEDAEQDLLNGFKRGEYTKEEVKENLLWAKKAGIHISNEAQKVLDGLSTTTGSAGGQSRTGRTSYSDPSLYSHTNWTGDSVPDVTAVVLILLAAITPDSKMNSKEALAFLIVFSLAARGYIF
ncbi:MAG: hypothetical protein JXC33_09095 [Deltaproteobacteria bacterium]|nr:hypothetical protein [Deltaproteobacteria bacterium]